MDEQMKSTPDGNQNREKRIDCLVKIRHQQNPTGSTCLDIDSLRRGSRSARRDAEAVGEPRELGKFVRVGEIDFQD